ncbi:MAG: hypothetical protein KGH75_04520 [Rhodospirillales bacterium]|nr:hypothetical protein [Rhodospirillales bacterium]
MRYLSRPYECDAMRWEGPRAGATFREIQEWGAPVHRQDSGPQLVLQSGGQRRLVAPGDWIVRNAAGVWYRTSDEAFRQEFDVQAPEADQPIPGFASVTAERVAFRRNNGSGWEWRHAGLTEAEAKAGGWEPLYVVEVPS